MRLSDVSSERPVSVGFRGNFCISFVQPAKPLTLQTKIDGVSDYAKNNKKQYSLIVNPLTTENRATAAVFRPISRDGRPFFDKACVFLAFIVRR